MKFYTHIAGALLFYLILAHFLNPGHLLLNLFIVSVISITPDILDKLSGTHRGMGHSILWIIPIIFVGLYNIVLGAALLVGFLSHIILDSFTVNGCPLLYPFKKTKFTCLGKKRRIKTGTNQDKSVFFFFIIFLIPMIIFSMNLGYLFNDFDSQYTIFAANSDIENVTESVSGNKNNFYLNFQLDENVNKNISIHRVDENLTTITIKDLEPGG